MSSLALIVSPALCSPLPLPGLEEALPDRTRCNRVCLIYGRDDGQCMALPADRYLADPGTDAHSRQVFASWSDEPEARAAVANWLFVSITLTRCCRSSWEENNHAVR
jgi:hypothetical protein